MFRFPWGDMHSLNLGWFLQKFNELREDWATAEAGIDRALDAEIEKAEDALSDVFDARDAAAASATAAAGSASSAGTSATAAQNSATAAASSATLANQKATAAGLSEAAAAQSATQAGNSATAAAGSATAAGNSATNAAGSATQAGQSATAAGNSASAAAASEAAARAVEESIPEDYSAVSNDVIDLKGMIKLLAASHQNSIFPISTGARNIFFSSVQLEAGTYYFRYTQLNSMTSNTRNTPYLQLQNPLTHLYQRISENWKLEAGIYEWKLTVATSGIYDIGLWLAAPDVEITITDIYFYQIDRIYETQESVAYINDGYRAERCYLKNDLFYMFNKLYIATTYIAEGARITVGTNCRETTIRELIKPLLPA